MKITKQTLGIVLLMGVVLTVCNYSLTLRTPEKESVYFRDFTRPLYVGVKPGVNTYTAGSPFESTYLFDYKTDGCPCAGIGKFYVLLHMVPNWQFFANVMVWSIFPATYIFILRKNENSRH